METPHVAILTPITSMFLHGGWTQILGNALFCWVFGNNIEDSMGPGRFLLFFLICGLAAAAAHVLVQPDSPIPTVGASGAIAGILGAYLGLFARVRVSMLFILVVFIKIIPLPAWVVLIYWFIVQVLTGWSQLTPLRPEVSSGVAVWAHVGGFVAGMALIKLFEDPRRVAARSQQIVHQARGWLGGTGGVSYLTRFALVGIRRSAQSDQRYPGNYCQQLTNQDVAWKVDAENDSGRADDERDQRERKREVRKGHGITERYRHRSRGMSGRERKAIGLGHHRGDVATCRRTRPAHRSLDHLDEGMRQHQDQQRIRADGRDIAPEKRYDRGGDRNLGAAQMGDDRPEVFRRSPTPRPKRDPHEQGAVASVHFRE